VSSHPINLGLRFLIELAAIISFGIWGWQKGEGWVRFVLAFGIPILAAILWGTFRVPSDPGKAPIAIPGILRLILELAIFVFAAWALYDSNFVTAAWLFGIIVSLHYISSYDRILWITKQ